MCNAKKSTLFLGVYILRFHPIHQEKNIQKQNTIPQLFICIDDCYYAFLITIWNRRLIPL